MANVKRPFRTVIITNVTIMTKIPDVQCLKNSALKIRELRFGYNFLLKEEIANHYYLEAFLVLYKGDFTVYKETKMTGTG